MFRPAWELVLSALAVAAITGLYGLLARHGAPSPGGWIGHLLGVVGFLLMLGAETLYTLRKRWPALAWGSMRRWMQFHVFMGIVGPYLVVLHSAGRFNGLAGVLTLLTVVMVLSGFVGRYFYTAAPRTLEGTEIALEELQMRIVRLNRELQALGPAYSAAAVFGVREAAPRRGWLILLARPILHWRYRRRLRQILEQRGAVDHPKIVFLERLLLERHRLQLQIDSLAAARRLLALWHLFHVPLGAVVFSLAFVHIGAALYYSTFLK